MTTMPLSAPIPSVAQSGRLSPLYVAFWGCMAALALAYLALLATRPDIAEMLILGPGRAVPEGNSGSRATAKAPASFEEMKRRLASLETQLGEMKLAETARERRELELLGRLAALERGSRVAEGDAVPASQQSAGADSSAKSKVLSGSTVRGTVEDRPMKITVLGSTPSQAGASSVAPQAKLAAAAVRAPESRALGVEIASGPSLDALKMSWQMLVDGHGPALHSLEPRYVELRSDPASFALIAGPVATSDDAVKICERLRTKKVACSITTFSGQPL
ncbi:MAG TPA: hypothetical protein VFV47_00895 [Hyphomicrobiaceae bacterium]|nr:hypothetical protein [Hyphomicrobiaceae bacterium]